MGDKEEGSGPKENPNPWGYYYLRYFVGAIVGAGLLVWVGRAAHQHGLPVPILPNLESGEFLHTAAILTAMGTAGLAYCYIASAPILVLHAMRGRFSKAPIVLNLIGVGVAVLILLLALVLFRCASGDPETWRKVGYVPFGVVLLFETLLVAWPSVERIRDFYHELAAARSRGKEEKKIEITGYVESYRHMREHGNAFLIILMERHCRANPPNIIRVSKATKVSKTSVSKPNKSGKSARSSWLWPDDPRMPYRVRALDPFLPVPTFAAAFFFAISFAS